MITQTDFAEALQRAIKEAGSQEALAQTIGMTQTQISDYKRGRFAIENITIGSLNKIFPNAQINFFGLDDELERDVATKTAEEDLLKIFRALPPGQQIHCLTLVAATFPNEAKKG